MKALAIVVGLVVAGIGGAIASEPAPAPAPPSPTLVFIPEVGDEGAFFVVPAGFQLAELRAELAGPDTDAAE
jgi:hypothetical protein